MKDIYNYNLADHIKKIIRVNGPISVAHYMSETTLNPNFGYYISEHPIGSTGDFITAPEISQMFGEIIGLWFGNIWLEMKKPKDFNFIELGPGKGTLMSDALRALNIIPNIIPSANIHLVEISEVLKNNQKTILSNYNVKWHNHISQIPNKLSYFIANEFFDSLPIHQFELTSLGWAERYISINQEEEFCFVKGNISNLDALTKLKLPVGSIVEISPSTISLIEEIGKILKTYNGVCLLIDYGDSASSNVSTLQGIRNHKKYNILKEQGKIDISAHVDFKSISKIAKKNGLSVYGPTQQGKFLTNLGIIERSRSLIKNSPKKEEIINNQLNRLIDETQMGKLFKVMALYSGSLFDIPGFN
ncbi:SAM-dependent methyltransferase [Alphaproteobacteria bacterium]|nr:SAM-dependent methyltransferase [Alphaproteobacteria bacterium]